MLHIFTFLFTLSMKRRFFLMSMRMAFHFRQRLYVNYHFFEKNQLSEIPSIFYFFGAPIMLFCR